MSDLHCEQHETPLVFSPETEEWLCDIDQDGCTKLGLADILMAVDAIVGFVEY